MMKRTKQMILKKKVEGEVVKKALVAEMKKMKVKKMRVNQMMMKEKSQKKKMKKKKREKEKDLNLQADILEVIKTLLVMKNKV